MTVVHYYAEGNRILSHGCHWAQLRPLKPYRTADAAQVTCPDCIKVLSERTEEALLIKQCRSCKGSGTEEQILGGRTFTVNCIDCMGSGLA